MSKEKEKRKLERKQIKDLANLKNHMAEQCELGAEKLWLKQRDHNVKIKEQFELFKEQQAEASQQQLPATDNEEASESAILHSGAYVLHEESARKIEEAETSLDRAQTEAGATARIAEQSVLKPSDSVQSDTFSAFRSGNEESQ